MQKQLRGIADRFGIDIGARRSRRTYAGFMELLVEHYRINLIVDVGANKGQFAKKMRKNRFDGRIVSIEPLAGSFASLQQSMVKDKDWLGLNIAVGSEAGTGEIYTTSDTSALASLHSSSSTVPDRFRAWAAAEKRIENVTIKTLDEVFDECVASIKAPRILLKCDTQGHDLEVLEGARDFLQYVHVLQIEVPVANLYESAPTFAESISKLELAGFSPTAFYPVSTTGKNGIVSIEFDCLAVRA